MTHAFTVSAVIPASPKEIYDAWLNGRAHALMTGTQSATGSTRVGGKIAAWDGYISGRNVELVPGRKIVQAWRTTEFSELDADSQITVTLAKAASGTKVTLRHSGVPDSHTGYKSGWADHYFAPMKAYFGALAAKTKAKKKPAAGKAKGKAPKRTAKKK
jgi:uncharacterized protein YndB with AHSA1/START domain